MEINGAIYVAYAIAITIFILVILWTRSTAKNTEAINKKLDKILKNLEENKQKENNGDKK